jgi:hypothetical protein
MTKDGSWFIAMNKVAGAVSLLTYFEDEAPRRLLSGNFLLVVSV